MSAASALLGIGAALIGVIYGCVRGGQLRNLANGELRWLPLLFLAAGVTGFAQAVPDATFDARFFEITAVTITIAGLALFVLYTLRNIHLVGAPIIALGIIINIAGIALNNGVSVDQRTLVSANVATKATLPDVAFTGARHVRNDQDRAWWLGDVIPIREMKHVMTFGDLVIVLGMASVAANLTHRRRVQPLELSSEARAGLMSIAVPQLRLDDGPVIDLDLLAEAATVGYASRTDEPVVARDDQREAGPRLGYGTEAGTGVRVPVLGKP